MQRYSRESVAYDLGRYEEPKRRAPELEVLETPKKYHVAKKPRSRVNFVTIAAVFAAGALLAFIVYYNMQLTAVTVEVAELRSELEELRREQDVLLVKNDERITLSEVEDIAVNQLGMVKLNRVEVEYIDLSNPDSIQFLGESESKVVWVETLMNCFNTVKEYFG